MTSPPRWHWAAGAVALILVTACTAPDPAVGAGGSPTAEQTAEVTEPGPSPSAPSPSSESPTDPPSTATSESGDPGTSAPTATEPGSGDDTAAPPTATSDPTASPSSSGPTPVDPRTTATPVVTYAQITGGTLTVNAHVSVLETDGTCTLRATRGDEEVTGSVAAFADATTTLCDPFDVDLPSGGRWTVDLTYSSSRSAGTTTFEVTT